jgi:hypothetical protein
MDGLAVSRHVAIFGCKDSVIGIFAMLDRITIRSAAFEELMAHPELAGETNSATVVTGTEAFVAPISLLRELAKAPDAGQRLADIADALIEEEYAFALTVLDEDDTGIRNSLWFQPAPGIQHGPRIKVMIDPAKAVRPGGEQATVPFDPDKQAEGDISHALERQVRAFIELNREALMKEWNREFDSSKKFLAAIKPLPKDWR